VHRAREVDDERAVDRLAGQRGAAAARQQRHLLAARDLDRGPHVVGGGGEADPLYGYLSSHILGQLDPVDREFLIATSLLDEVTAPRAEALGLRRAGERLIALRAAHLPVSWDPEGRVMRCHSRFREYLLERLERLGDEELRDLRLAHAHQLAAEGLHEEATEEFLRADAPAEALRSAELAIMRVIERADVGVAERWLDALADVAPLGSSVLTTAELMLAVGHEDHRRVPGAFGDHDVRLASGSLAARVAGTLTHATKSHHHQAVDRIGAGLEVTGWASVDDLPEALEDPSRRFALGVQWHPERTADLRVFAALAEAAARAAGLDGPALAA
jgi:hypothetical protein